MSIEFRCPHCQRLLRVPDGSQGKQAQCPQCQAMVQVPGPGAPPPATPPGGPSPGAANPFATNFPAAGAAPPSDNPYQAPSATLMAPQSGAPQPIYPIVPTKMDLGDVLNRTWEIYKANFGMLLLVVFVVLIVYYAAAFICGMVGNVAVLAVGEPAVAIVVQTMSSIVQNVVYLWLALGQFRYMLKTARGQPAEFTDIFTGGPYLIRAILGTIVISLIVAAIGLVTLGPAGVVYLATQDQQAMFVALAIGAVFFIPLAYFVFLSTFQYQPLIIDRDMGTMDALRTSYEVMSGNRLALFALLLIIFLLLVVGCVACLVPGLFVLAYMAIAQAVIYLVITGQPTADQLMRGAPPPMQAPPMA